MLFAVLFFEDKTEQTVRHIWQALTENQIATNGIDKDVSPHITLGMFQSSQQNDLPQQVASFIANITTIPIIMPNFGIFTSPYRIIYLGVTVTDRLYDFHRGLYRAFDAQLDTTTLFVPATYVPHCTLAYNVPPDKLPIALSICQQFPLPIITHANRIALVESETGLVLHEYPFQTTS